MIGINLPSKEQTENAHAIVRVIAQCCNTTESHIFSDNKKRHIAAYPRMLSYLFIRAFTDLTYTQIDWIFDRKPCTVVICTINIIELLEVKDMVITEMFNKCRIELTRGNHDRIQQLQQTITGIKKRRNERNLQSIKRKYTT